MSKILNLELVMGRNPGKTRPPAGLNFGLPGCDFQYPVPGFNYPDPLGTRK